MKRMFPMILLFALLLCVPVRADELTLDAPSALLMEKQTGTVLFAKDEHTPRARERDEGDDAAFNDGGHRLRRALV